MSLDPHCSPAINHTCHHPVMWPSVSPFWFLFVTSGQSSCSKYYSCRTKKSVSFTTFWLAAIWAVFRLMCSFRNKCKFFFLSQNRTRGGDIGIQDTFITSRDLDLVRVMLRQWWMSPDKHQQALQKYILRIEVMHWVWLIRSKMAF